METAQSAQKKWKREISAGGVVYKKSDGQTFVLLINPRSRDYGPPEDYWTFPKGKQDIEKEDLKQVAVREVREEGGVNAQIEQELGYVKYFRNWKGDEAIKFVHYFLMKHLDGSPDDHDEEVAQAKWVELDKVEPCLKWPTDKEVFERALSHLRAAELPKH
jgi:8-oxo-dGTP pyrophosphatase MutT (NUDIX family)